MTYALSYDEDGVERELTEHDEYEKIQKITLLTSIFQRQQKLYFGSNHNVDITRTFFIY